MSNKYYPVAFILLIAAAVYIIYGKGFMPSVDLVQYKEVCNKYKTDTLGKYSNDDKLMLVNQVNYLLPDRISELTDSLEIEVKSCANQLAAQINQ
jgi:hypothetical protein